MNQLLMATVILSFLNIALANDKILVKLPEIKINKVTEIYLPYDVESTNFKVLDGSISKDVFIVCQNNYGMIKPTSDQYFIYLNPGSQVKIKDSIFMCDHR